MLSATRPFAATYLIVFLTAAVMTLVGCGGSPPSGQVNEEIRKSVLASRQDIFNGGESAAEVVGISLKGWKESEMFTGEKGAPKGASSEWTAKLRFKEPIGFILAEVDGVKIVKVMAKSGDEVPFEGRVVATKFEGKWEIGSFEKGEPWDGLWKKTGGVTMGYQSFTDNGSQAVGRGTTFRPLSTLKPYVEENSEEMKKLMAGVQERQQKAQEAAIASQKQRQEAYAAQQKAQQEAYAAQQKQQQEAYAAQQKAQQEAYAAQLKKAQEEAQQRALEQRRTRLTPLVAPFQSASGVILTNDTGRTMGAVITEAKVDTDAFSITGKGIDLRTMPFREFTFEATSDDRGTLSYKTSLAPTPIAFAASPAGLVSRAGFSAAALTDADRATIDALVASGKQLGSAAAQVLTPEILDAASAKAREASMTAGALTGTVLFREKVGPTLVPMFAGDLAANKAYKWSKETVALRLAQPVKAKAIYIRGTAATTDNLVVVINGVHRATIDSIAKMGGAVVPLPADLEVLDIRLDAVGTAQTRGVMLIK